MREVYRFPATIGIGISSILLLTGCDVESRMPQTITQDINDSRAVLEALDNAQTITLQKRLISWRDHWNVSVDGTQVAEVRGLIVPVIGDTYSMFSNAGNLVGSEGEEFRLALNEARLFDYNNEYIGSINQNFTLLLYNFNLTNPHGEQIGYLQQNFGIALNATLNNTNSSCAYRIRKAVLSLGARITVERCGETEIPAINAVWMAMILNEIDEARNSSRSNTD